MEFQQNKPYVFISYAHKDQEVVLPIINLLKQYDINLWYDSGIEAGSEWPEYIAEKIISSDRIICFISDNYQLSQNCSRELNFAISEKKEILSVFLKDKVELTPGMRMQLGSYQSIFYSRFANHFELCKSLKDENFIKNCKFSSSTTQEQVKQPPKNDDKKPQEENNSKPQKETGGTNVSEPNPQEPSNSGCGTVIFVIFILACLIGLISNYFMEEVAIQSVRYKHTFDASLWVTGICVLVRLFWLSCTTRMGKFKKWMMFFILSAIAVILNYYACFLVIMIPGGFGVVSVIALIIINILIEVINFFVIAICD